MLGNILSPFNVELRQGRGFDDEIEFLYHRRANESDENKDIMRVYYFTTLYLPRRVDSGSQVSNDLVFFDKCQPWSCRLVNLLMTVTQSTDQCQRARQRPMWNRSDLDHYGLDSMVLNGLEGAPEMASQLLTPSR